MKYQPLVKKAQAAKLHSYSPYSNFRVGAAVLTSSGKVFTGCNIENSSISLTVCAERTALFKALSEGNYKFEAIAIASDAEEFIPPCGACRQVMMEFGADIDVVLTNSKGKTKILKMATLLPYPFTGKFL
jgi:cytidine deaminase